jgi:hypothetical protein
MMSILPAMPTCHVGALAKMEALRKGGYFRLFYFHFLRELPRETS